MEKSIGLFFLHCLSHRSGLPRFAATEGALSFLLIEKKQKIKAWILSCKKLLKSLLRQYLGSYPCFVHSSRLILPWIVGL
jgi:CubicO group peptidase (beta-lactamase class C family)